jgi:NADPH:quinone reductase-like Zn-dependent oxidoreductase
MKAIAIDDYGAPATLHELPAPTPAAGEVLVKVMYSSINGFDLAVANGYLKGLMEHHFPVVLGKDFAGTVAALGSGVDGLSVGDHVFGVVMKDSLGDGSFGEYVTVPATFTAHVPAGLDLATAGALGLAGTAAINAVDAIAPAHGETVLVAGATGGVGAFVVQLAAARGAYVIATAQPGEEVNHVRQLGAAETVDYTADLTASVVALRPDGVHAVVHLAGDGLQLAKLIVPGGRIASTLGLTADSFAGHDVVAIPIMAAPIAATLERLADQVVAGHLRVPIQDTYTLEQVPQAFADYSAGSRGKLSVQVS